jgi:2-oxoglutarate ferredoxin oxidoreductase subunit beta
LTAYGKRVGFKDSGEMLKWFKQNAVSIKSAEGMSEKDLNGKIVVGEFVQRKRPTLVKTIYQSIKEAQK